MRKLACHWLIFLGTALFVLSAWQLLLSGDPLNPFSDGMREAWLQMAPLFLVLLALLPVFIWDTVKFSNHFAGPMLRLRRAIRALADGEKVQPLKFRNGDFWIPVADDFNAMLKTIDAAAENGDRRRSAGASDEPVCDGHRGTTAAATAPAVRSPVALGK